MADLRSLIDNLAETSLLRAFSDEELTELLRSAARRDLKRNEVVIHQGDDGFYLPSDRLDSVRELMTALPPATKQRERDLAIAAALHVSERTARSLRLAVEDDE